MPPFFLHVAFVTCPLATEPRTFKGKSNGCLMGSLHGPLLCGIPLVSQLEGESSMNGPHSLHPNAMDVPSNRPWGSSAAMIVSQGIHPTVDRHS